MLNKIYFLLSNLGITANYSGFFYVSYAVHLAVSDMENLLMVTKRIYPEIAEHYHTSSKNVERSIRTIINIIWENNPDLLSRLSHIPLNSKPTSAEFIAMLTTALMFSENNQT